MVVTGHLHLPLPLLPHRRLLHLQLLLLPHLQHHLLHTGVHLLLVVVLTHALTVGPSVLQNRLQSNPLLRIGVQHLLDEV